MPAIVASSVIRDGDWSSGFNPRRPGPDHVAFACGDRAELERWQDRLEELGIEHGGIVDAHYGSGLSFKDPDGIALEFFRPAGLDGRGTTSRTRARS